MPSIGRPKSASRTTREILFLHFIADFSKKEKRPPALRDFVRSRKLKVKSVSTVNYYLETMEQEGFIKRTPKVSRGLRLTAKGQKAIEQLPILTGKAPG